jgi:eukaryotic-like serine/threonine-protein kinase
MGAKLFDSRSLGRQFVDRYELMGEIASGGMASVYLARVTGVGGFQRLFALKRLHPHLQGEKEFVQMFLDEARLAAGIHHPNVVPILEVGSSPQAGYYLVMEYVEGETFARLLARASASRDRVPEPVVIRIVLDMLRGLHAAHELKDEAGQPAGVVHRDVSPQNLLVGVDGIGRITDFGVARAASRLNATRAGQLKGKIAYMAPEQAMGTEGIDRRADVFAGAVVLWEGLAHKRLFKAETEAATLARVIAEEVPHLRVAAPRIPESIAHIVMHGLERDLNRRFSTCAEFADALEYAAQASGMLITSRDLGSYMDRMLGPELATQATALREWCSLAESLPVPSSSQLTPSFGRLSAMTSEKSGTMFQEPSLTRKGTWGRAVVGGLAVAALAGGFVIYKAAGRITSDSNPAGDPVRMSTSAEPKPDTPSPASVSPAAADSKTEPGSLSGVHTTTAARAGEPSTPSGGAKATPIPSTPTVTQSRRGLVESPSSPDRTKPARPSKGGTDALLDSNPYR